MTNSKPLLCLGCGMGFENVTIPEQVEIIKSVGFDAFFYDRRRNATTAQTEEVAVKGAKLGIGFQSIHAPFFGMDDMWHVEDEELPGLMVKELKESIDDCKEFDVPLVIMHAIIGMDNHNPTKLGLERIEKIIDYAVKKGITIAFENTEGEEYLRCLLDTFGDVPNVGFCIDTGHEMCYNFSRDLIGAYGKYLVSTHLNDNMGITDPENITFYDDAHLLPFDGIADWEGIAKRLHKCGYNGTLTFEVNHKSKPERTANDIYNGLSCEAYIAKAYEKAVKFQKLFMETK